MADNRGELYRLGSQVDAKDFVSPLDPYKEAADSEKTLRGCIHSRNVAALVGDPGTTKTAKVRNIAEEMGYGLVTIIGAQKEAPDIAGFPTRGEYIIKKRDKDGNEVTETVPVTEYAPQKWQHFVVEHRKVFIFLDEFSNTHPSTRAGMLSFIQDREFPDGTPFPDETVIILAMNPTESAPDGYELDPATRNRVNFIDWRPNNQEWLKDMLNKWGAVNPDSNNGLWRADIVRFLKDNMAFIHKMPEDTINNEIAASAAYGINVSNASARMVAESPWPSYRTWDFLADWLGTNISRLDPLSHQFTRDSGIRGFVGPEAATKFTQWLESNGSLNIAEHLANPDNYDLEHWGSLSGNDWVEILSTAVSDEYVTKDAIENVIRVFEILIEVGVESLSGFTAPDISSALNRSGVSEKSRKYTELQERLLNVILTLTGNNSQR